MTDHVQRTIDAARRSFNRMLLAPEYSHIHDDKDHIDRLIALLDPQRRATYLDLATGNGELAFAIAGHQPESQVLGLDIADMAIARNQATADALGCSNLSFRVADGRRIDLPDAVLDGVTSRYALHHFPDIRGTLADVHRVLRPGTVFVTADAVRHAADDWDFINQFQALEPDGHVRIYTGAALIELICGNGFEADEQFASTLSFTRELNADYHELIRRTPSTILDLYEVAVAGDRARLTFDVLNARFIASAASLAKPRRQPPDAPSTNRSRSIA